MMMKGVLRSIASGISDEIKEAASILRRVRLGAGTSAMGANFRKYGQSFGIFEYDAYVQRARDFYKEAMRAQDPQFTRVVMDDDRIAIDYNGEVRGIYSRSGRPLAFFRPDHHQLGYPSKSAELEAFKANKAMS